MCAPFFLIKKKKKKKYRTHFLMINFFGNLILCTQFFLFFFQDAYLCTPGCEGHKDIIRTDKNIHSNCKNTEMNEMTFSELFSNINFICINFYFFIGVASFYFFNTRDDLNYNLAPVIVRTDSCHFYNYFFYNLFYTFLVILLKIALTFYKRICRKSLPLSGLNNQKLDIQLT